MNLILLVRLAILQLTVFTSVGVTSPRLPSSDPTTSSQKTPKSEFQARRFLGRAEALVHDLDKEDAQIKQNKPSIGFDSNAASILLHEGDRHSELLFEGLTDQEAYRLCVALERLENRMRDWKDEQTLQPGAWQGFIRLYPDSPLAAKAEWAVVRISAIPYEYENQPEVALDEVKIYEKFLTDHPDTPCREEAEFARVRALRIAYECYRFVTPNVHYTKQERREVAFQNQRRKGLACRAKARQILESLLNSKNSEIAAKAQRTLEDLNRGKCVYMGYGIPGMPPDKDSWDSTKK